MRRQAAGECKPKRQDNLTSPLGNADSPAFASPMMLVGTSVTESEEVRGGMTGGC